MLATAESHLLIQAALPHEAALLGSQGAQSEADNFPPNSTIHFFPEEERERAGVRRANSESAVCLWPISLLHHNQHTQHYNGKDC